MDALPFSLTLDMIEFSITKQGKLTSGAVVGDADAEATSVLNLPITSWERLVNVPFSLRTKGGDYASGWWSFDGVVEIRIQK